MVEGLIGLVVAVVVIAVLITGFDFLVDKILNWFLK